MSYLSPDTPKKEFLHKFCRLFPFGWFYCRSTPVSAFRLYFLPEKKKYIALLFHTPLFLSNIEINIPLHFFLFSHPCFPMPADTTFQSAYDMFEHFLYFENLLYDSAYIRHPAPPLFARLTGSSLDICKSDRVHIEILYRTVRFPFFDPVLL